MNICPLRNLIHSFVWIFLLSSVSLSSINAQHTVSGTVTDAGDKSVMIGVSIVDAQTKSGVITDLDGNFSIQCDPQTTLTFSFVGYVPQIVQVNNQTAINIALESDSKLLENVIVTGYKSEIKSNVTSSIASVKGKDIDKLAVLGIDQALQGQAAGIQVTQTSGAPGDGVSVRIRGVGTVGNNNPLYIIDGMPTTGDINMFSTHDIESVEVLKDAAAAIYGARAANGVIVITTKKGKAGDTKFSFNTTVGISQAYRLPKLLNTKDYLDIRNAAIVNANTLRDPARQLDTYPTSIVDTLANVNWLNEVFHPAPYQTYSLSATGGTENARYFIMGEYLDEKGVFKGQGFKKYGVRFNGEAGNKWLKVGNSLYFAYTDQNRMNSTGDGFGGGNELNVLRYALIAAPVFRIRNADGSYVNTSSELGDPLLYGDGNANPLALIDATDWTIQRSRFFGNVYAEAKILPGLKARTSLGGDFTFENEKKFKQKLSASIYNPTSLNEGRVFGRNMIWNNTLDYTKDFGRNHASILIGMEAIQNNTNYLGASANNFTRTDPNFRNIDNSVQENIKNIGASGITTYWALLSYFAQADYNFDNRYIIGASVRKDGSSRFGKENRWGVFPRISAAWNISNESFFSGINFIDNLKLRASWGKMGNQEIGLYPYSSLVGTGIRVYSFGDNIVTGAQILETGNSKIKWETTTMTNLGLDFSILKGRLTFIFDVYNKKTQDMLVQVPLPESAGEQTPPFVNAGSVENKGIELGAIYNNRVGEFSYTVGGNFSANRNNVLSLSTGEPLLGGFGLSDGAITKTEVGYPIGSFFLYEMAGIFQTQEEIEASPFQTKDTRPGDVKFADLNGDNKIDDKDRAHLGSPFPDFSYGLNLGFTWRNFDFSTLIQGVKGNDIYFLYGNFAYETQSRGFNSYEDIKDYWRPDNTNTSIPKVSLDDRNGNRRISTRFLYDGSYLKVRNVTLGYNLKSVFKTKSITGLRIYITGQNLLTFTKYPGLDPEIQANNNDTQGLGISSDLSVGIDWGTVPAPRKILFGINLNF